MSFGFCHSNKDFNMYFFIRYKKLTIIVLYVNDIIITFNDDELINQLQTRIIATFKMKNLRDVKYYLRVELEWICEGIYFFQ